MSVGRSLGVDRWLLVGVLVCLVTMAVHRLFAWDIWWQIAAGRFIAAHGIPTVDPFSFGFPGMTWIEPRWLWCLLVFAVYSTLGVNALIVLKLGLLVAALTLMVVAGRGQPGWAVALGGVMVLVGANERFMVRPELLSFVALMATLLWIRGFKQGRMTRAIWWLPVMQVVWCNAHTLWVLGPVTLWIVVIAETVEGRLSERGLIRPRPDTLVGSRLRSLALLASVDSLVTIFNPYLVQGVLFPFGLFREIRSGHMFSEAISEFRSPFSDLFFGGDFRTLGLIAVIAVSALGFVLNRHRTPLSRLALWGAYLFVAVEAQRNVALFAWVAGFVTMLNLGQWYAASPVRFVPALARSLVATFVLVMVPAVAGDEFYRSQRSLKRFGFGVSEHRYPIRALAFVRERGLPTPVIHALGDGGYVMFEGGESSVYADGRLEVYGAEALERAFRVTWTGDGLEQESDRTGAHTVILRNDMASRPLLVHMEQSPEWSPVYYDPLHLVYVRNSPPHAAMFDELTIDWNDPTSYPVAAPVFPGSKAWPDGRASDGYADERLGSLLAGVGNYRLALGHFERAYAQAPSNPRARLFLGLFREAEGRDSEAELLLGKVPAAFFEDPMVHVLAGNVDLWADNPSRAVEHFRQARDRGAPEPDISLRLARAALIAEDETAAEDALGRLEQSHPGQTELWNLRAVLEIKRGRPDRAAGHFERSLEIDANQDDVRARLEQLRGSDGSH